MNELLCYDFQWARTVDHLLLSHFQPTLQLELCVVDDDNSLVGKIVFCIQRNNQLKHEIVNLLKNQQLALLALQALTTVGKPKGIVQPQDTVRLFF